MQGQAPAFDRKAYELRGRTEQPGHSLSMPFWLKCFSYFHLSRMTVFTQIYLYSPFLLSNAYLSHS
jgi:hypothetical protein